MASAFDLDQFAPPPVRVKLRGVEYVIDGDPDVELVARMLRIEDALEGDNPMEAAFEGRDLILELIQARRPDVTEIKVSPREILQTFYLLMRGEGVAAAVGRALSNPDAVAAQPVEGGESAVTTGESGVDAEGSPPLASERSLPGRSSLSDGETDGVLVTGIAV